MTCQTSRLISSATLKSEGSGISDEEIEWDRQLKEDWESLMSEKCDRIAKAATAPFSASATRPARGFRSPISIRSSPPRPAIPSPPSSWSTPGDEWGPNARKTIESLQPACSVLRFGDLASRPFDWPDLVHEKPEALTYRREPFSLRPHQKTALDEVTGGFEAQDRGQLIMACGTGKTFAALRIAEAVAGIGGRVLYLVPSISLFQQSMREWATQRAIPHRYIGICSDTRAGRKRRGCIASGSLRSRSPRTRQRFRGRCGYRARTRSPWSFAPTTRSVSWERAQDDGAPAFDIVLCDEAHRTTGIERPGDPTSPFVLVHDAQRIRAAKRLYMTATPRLYTEGAKAEGGKPRG